MAKSVRMEFKSTLDEGMRKYFERAGISKTSISGADLKGREAVGEYVLFGIAEGSSRNPLKPPKKSGALRASGSSHIYNHPAHITTDSLPVTGEENATPHKGSMAGTRDTISIVFNRAYAARWEENDFNPGEISLLNGPVGPHYIKGHLASDVIDALRLYAMIFKRETGG